MSYIGFIGNIGAISVLKDTKVLFIQESNLLFTYASIQQIKGSSQETS